VRLLAAAVAIATAIGLVAAPRSSGAATGQAVLLALLAGAAAVAASERRSRAALNSLALSLLLAVTLHTVALMALEPASLWQLGAVVSGVMLSGALFLQWSWTWQIALSFPLVAVTVIAGLQLAPRIPGARGELVPVAITVTAAAAISIIGARLLWQGRERIAASEKRYRRLFEAAPTGIALVDSQGTIVELNKSLASLLGRPAADLAGTKLTQHLALIQPDGRDPESFFRERFALAIDGQGQAIVAYVRTAQGVSVETEMAFWRVETGKGPLVQVLVRDLTEHRRLERQEERRRRLDALGRLAGNMAQRFDSLFREIAKAAEELRVAAASERDRGLSGEIIANAAEGSRLSRELTRFGRQERLVIGQVNTRILVSQIEALARAVLPDDLKVEATVEVDLPDLAGDKDHLAHAALQLLLNAREAMPDGGKLTISAGTVRVHPGTAAWPGTVPGDYVRLSITDTGTGMEPALLEHVFEPFLSAAPLYEGRATGLPAVYGIVRAHGGSLRSDSAPSRGTSVHLLVPVWKETTEARPENEAVRDRKQRASVLVVDPDELTRTAVRRALMQLGYRVIESPDADSAIGHFHAADPPVDAVILGGPIPDGGHRLFEALRSLKPDLAIVVGLDSPETAGADSLGRLRDLKADGFVARPYEKGQLTKVLARVLGESD
jgi:PAS domain S-box-containing protein